MQYTLTTSNTEPALKLFHAGTDRVLNSDPSLLETQFETAEQTPPCPERNTKLRFGLLFFNALSAQTGYIVP